MILFDHYDAIFEYLHENLPKEVKYKFLYDHHYYDRFAPPDRYNKKYGRPKVPYGVFFDLQRYGYAAIVNSKETFEKTFDREKYILMWSKIEEAINKNLFPSTDLENYRLLSVNEACKMLGLTRPSVYKLIKQNEIPVVQIFDKTKKIQLKDLLKFIEQKKQKGR